MKAKELTNTIERFKRTYPEFSISVKGEKSGEIVQVDGLLVNIENKTANMIPGGFRSVESLIEAIGRAYPDDYDVLISQKDIVGFEVLYKTKTIYILI